MNDPASQYHARYTINFSSNVYSFSVYETDATQYTIIYMYKSNVK